MALLRACIFQFFYSRKKKEHASKKEQASQQGRQNSVTKCLEVFSDKDYVPDEVKIFASDVFKMQQTENWAGILKVVPESDLLWSIVNDIVLLFTSSDKAGEIYKFLANYMEPALERVLNGKLEIVRINMRWIDGIQSEPRPASQALMCLFLLVS